MNALLVVDVQNDFCPGGSLAVNEGDKVVPYINGIRDNYPLVVFSQDWHPAAHRSFSSNNPGTRVGDFIKLGGHDQVMWPDHCVQDTAGAEFRSDLEKRDGDPVVRKGELVDVDSYSAFFDNDHRHETGLRALLEERGVTAVDVMGLATDYCVKFTVLDALKLAYQVTVLREGCRAVDLQPGDGDLAFQQIEAAGAQVR